MYKRVIYDNWSLIIPVACFAFTIVFYGVMVLRALLLRREKQEEMAALPLND